MSDAPDDRDDGIRPDRGEGRARRREDDGYEERPRRRRGDDDEPKKSSKTWLWVLIGALVVLPLCCVGGGAALLLPAVSKVREAAARMNSGNNLKLIGLGVHNHAASNGDLFPPQDIKDATGKPILSWRVAILPYVEAENVYRQFNLQEPWDGPTNRRLLAQMPKVYLMPSRQKPDEAFLGMTYYQRFKGRRAVFDPTRELPVGLAGIVDGTSNTLLVVEGPAPVEWSKPGDIPYDPAGAPQLTGHASGMANVLYCDGSVRAVRPRPGAEFDRKLKLAIQIDDGIIEELD
jgi:prepilin-type processing-associated H-X9-DG protein